jgi:hypothetical protein
LESNDSNSWGLFCTLTLTQSVIDGEQVNRKDFMSEEITENVAEVEATEEATSEVENTQQDPVETETTVTETSTDEANENLAPKDNKAWAAMRTELKRLKEAEGQSSVDAQYLKELEDIGKQEYQPQVTQQQYQGMDETTRAITQANENSRRAIIEANNNRREVEDMLAEERFPELKTDPVFKQLVAEKRLASEVMGKRKTTIVIATEVAKLLNIKQQQADLQADERAKKEQAQRQVAVTEGRTESSQGKSTYDNNEARIKIAHGDQAYTEQHLKDKYLTGLDF